MKDFLMKRINKKRLGFTLIELLAVIAVLTIILLIAVPSVISIISEARLQSNKKNEQLLVKGATNYLYDKSITVGNGETIKKTLTDMTGYVGNIKDAITKNDCLGYTTTSTTNNTPTSNSYIKCDNYTTPGYTDNTKISAYKTLSGALYESIDNIVVASDGYILTGWVSSADGDFVGLNKGGYDAMVVKTDFDGKIIWKKTFGGSLLDAVYESAITNDGIILVGAVISNDYDFAGLNKGVEDALIMKLDLNGNIIWKQSIGGLGVDRFNSIATDSTGYIVVGETVSNTGDFLGLNKGNTDAVIMKFDVNGNILWKKLIGGTYDDSFDGIVAVADGYVATGSFGSNDGDFTGLWKAQMDISLVKLDLSGNIVWKKSFGGNLIESPYGIIDTGDGFIVTMYSESSTLDLLGMNKGDDDAVLVKFDYSGNVVWKKNFGGTNFDYLYETAKLDDGYLSVGYSGSTDFDLAGLNKGGSDPIVVKFDLNGNVLWKETYGGTANDGFISAVKSGSDVIVSGFYRIADGEFSSLANNGTNPNALYTKFINL